MAPPSSLASWRPHDTCPGSLWCPWCFQQTYAPTSRPAFTRLHGSPHHREHPGLSLTHLGSPGPGTLGSFSLRECATALPAERTLIASRIPRQAASTRGPKCELRDCRSVWPPSVSGGGRETPGACTRPSSNQKPPSSRAQEGPETSAPPPCGQDARAGAAADGAARPASARGLP